MDPLARPSPWSTCTPSPAPQGPEWTLRLAHLPGPRAPRHQHHRALNVPETSGVVVSAEKLKSEGESHSIVSDSATPRTIQSMQFSRPEYRSSLSLLQGIFPTQGSNRSLLHCRQILHQLSYQGSPRILERVVYPFSSRYSRPRNRTGVSCIAGRFFIK